MRSVWLLSLALLLAGCTTGGDPAPPPDSDGEEPPTKEDLMTIQSTAFEHNETIPTKYTADGENISPPLRIQDPPDGTATFALIVDDPDAPRPEPWVHWLLWNIPASAEAIPEGYPPSGNATAFDQAQQGTNDFDNIEYGGPAPPEDHGEHRYRFTLYALDTPLDLEDGATRSQLDASMDGHVLTQDRTVGVYER